MTAVSLFGILRRVRGRTLCQSNVPTATMKHDADQRGHRDLGHDGAEGDDQDEQEDAGQQGGQSRPRAGGLHIDHRVADHGRSAHAAEQGSRTTFWAAGLTAPHHL
jgi:hypothetical protein